MCTAKVSFLYHPLTALTPYTHIYARGSIDTHTMDDDDVKTEGKSTTNDLNTFPARPRFIFMFKSKAGMDRMSRASR